MIYSFRSGLGIQRNSRGLVKLNGVKLGTTFVRSMAPLDTSLFCHGCSTIQTDTQRSRVLASWDSDLIRSNFRAQEFGWVAKTFWITTRKRLPSFMDVFMPFTILFQLRIWYCKWCTVIPSSMSKIAIICNVQVMPEIDE